MSVNILVVDDSKISRESTASYLAELGYRAVAHDNAFSALEALDDGRWDLVITDLRMPSMDGLQFLREVKSRAPDTAVIIMTAYGTVETAVEALRRGARDYLLKPFPLEQLRIHVERLLELIKAQEELGTLRRQLGVSTFPGGLVGASPQMKKVFQLIEQFAGRAANVLITGETGTGKEMVARALHEHSSRKNGPFVAVPCGAIPRELAESELFGHEAGAFTSAQKRRRGYVEMADGGTLFLDDVDDLPQDLQPKLLRVIEQREFQRVGGERALKADLRFISSTKRDLEALVHEGKFRQDLLYRLQVLSLALPPLRERDGDIPLLAQHFLGLISRETGGAVKTLSAEAQQRLVAHDWPGNVRELRHAIEYAVAVSPGQTIGADDLQLRRGQQKEEDKLFTLTPGAREELDLRALQAELEKQATMWALQRSQGDQSKAAQMLKMPRTTFIYRLRQLYPAEADAKPESTQESAQSGM